MPLNAQQVSQLEAAVAEYAFPAIYFNFRARVEMRAGNMLAVEAAIRNMLISPEIDRVRDGLANVIYRPGRIPRHSGSTVSRERHN
jgi:hypothetical protein